MQFIYLENSNQYVGQNKNNSMYKWPSFHPKGAMNSKKHLFLEIKEEREGSRKGEEEGGL